MDNQLLLSYHIRNLKSKLTRAVERLYKLQRFLTTFAFFRLRYAIFHPYLRHELLIRALHAQALIG